MKVREIFFVLGFLLAFALAVDSTDCVAGWVRRARERDRKFCRLECIR